MSWDSVIDRAGPALLSGTEALDARVSKIKREMNRNEPPLSSAS